jgi:hypothetical protein
VKFAGDFESFLKQEVNLDQGRIDRLQERVDAVESFLAGHEDFADVFVDFIPAGSWAHSTIIRPVQVNDEFDADVLMLVEDQDGWDPADFIQETYSTFRSSSKYRSMVHRKTRCIRVQYAGDFHIDVVPYVERGGRHFVTNRSEPPGVGRFELSYPEGVTSWIDERQRLTNGTFIKVIRLVKYLRDFKNTFDCKSIILTTLLGERVSTGRTMVDPTCYADTPSTLISVMTDLADNLPASMPAVMDPGGSGDNFTDRYGDSWNYENFRSRIKSYAELMQGAYEEQDREASIAAWRRVFGDGFKPGILAKAADIAPLSASIPWDQEEHITDPAFGYVMALDPRYKARIGARVTGFRVGQSYRRHGFREFDLSKRGNRVQKNRNIQFKLSTNVPGEFDVYWKVRNGGSEAASARQLRGEIKETEGMVKNEPTAFTGYHYVECYVVQGGRVVAMDRQDVIVT